MGPDYFEQAEEYNLNNLLYAGLLAGAVLLGFYFLWSWCTGDKNDNKTNNESRDKGRLFMKPVYAHEIEPGIVVLQSEDGDYFKILKEYELNSGTNNLYGSFSCTRPENAQPRVHGRLDGSTSRPDMALRQGHTQNPSAPLLLDSVPVHEAPGTLFNENVNLQASYGTN